MKRNPMLGAAAGLAGGLIGSWVMVRFNHLVGGIENPNAAAREARYRHNATPNDTDGTISDEPASMKMASALAKNLTGKSLNEREKRIGGPVMHYGFGAVVGAIYGAAAERTPGATTGFGVPFGATVWLAADEIGLPLSGLASDPRNYPAPRHAAALGTHLVYGATVEAVRRLLRGRATARPA